MHPSIRAILAAIATTLAILTTLPAGDPGGPNKGGSTGIWIVPSPLALQDIAHSVASHNFAAARATHRAVSIAGDMTFELNPALGDQLAAIAVDGANHAIAVNGLFLTVPEALLVSARASGARTVDILITNGVEASGIVIELLPSGATANLHLF